MRDEYTDSLELKIFLIYHLLVSIRMDFGDDSALTERHSLALKLTGLAIKECEGDIAKADKLKTLRQEIERFKPFKMDGRFFRDEFPHGYIGMLEYFGMKEEKES